MENETAEKINLKLFFHLSTNLFVQFPGLHSQQEMPLNYHQNGSHHVFTSQGHNPFPPFLLFSSKKVSSKIILHLITGASITSSWLTINPF
jgi:hypothetical protein